MPDYVVGLERRHPFEYMQVEVFTEEEDAIDYAIKYAIRNGFILISRRTWVSNNDNEIKLTVRKR